MADYSFVDIGGNRKISSEEEEYVGEGLQLFMSLSMWRSTFASQWEEVAQLVMPSYRNTFQYGAFNWPGTKKTEKQIDATGMRALSRFGAICDSLVTPRNMMWHGLAARDPELQKIRRVRLWFEKTTRQLFDFRYAPEANFAGQNFANWLILGAFGTTGMYVDEFETEFGFKYGPRYRSIPLGELFLLENHQGLIDGFVRWYRLTARQVMQKWGPTMFPEQLRPALNSNSQWPFNFLHIVRPRRDRDQQAIGYKGMPWESCNISIEGKCVMQKGGYRSFPMPTGRYIQTPGETYGRSPAMNVLPALKTINLQKAIFLKQGHRAADPILLTSDDGLSDGISYRPGSLNKGGVGPKGEELVRILPTGQIAIAKEMLEMEAALINDEFLVTLFQILTETPQMTATEVIERTNEKGILLAPTIGRQSSEYVGPLVHRELDILSSQGRLDPMPPELVEAGGEYQVVHTSPLARAMHAQEAAGFMRTVESVREIVAITGDPSPLDRFDFDTAVPAIAAIQAVPESWLCDDRMVGQKRAARAQAQRQQMQIQALPGMAAMANAQTKARSAQGSGQAFQPANGGGALQPAPQGQPQFAPQQG
jgi:hypothetical protein